MFIPANTLSFLLTTVECFEKANLSSCVFGGWAEEIWQITPARSHNDIDLLYSSETFAPLDRFIAETEDFHEITAKRFSHKRAISHKDVLIEFLLVQAAGGSYFTDFFSGRYRITWPDDVFSHKVRISGQELSIASKQALLMYRQRHKQVELAYQTFLATSGKQCRQGKSPR